MSSSARVGVAYAALCLVWGSTYLAIRVGVGVLPPALFAGVRHFVAGALLFLVVAWVRGTGPIRRTDVWRAGVVGLLLLFLANGLVVWAEQFVHSGPTAIFVVTVSLFLAFFDALIPGSRARPTWTQAAGLMVGFLGCVLLVGADLETLRTADWRGPLALLVASAAWALGSIYAQRRPTGTGPYVNAALQMVWGGGALLLLGTAVGEWDRVTPSSTGLLALGYLILFGSIVGFTSYVYVLRHLSATLAGTYVYANTVVAVLLGWLLLDEPVTGRTLLAMGLVIGSVVWVRQGDRLRRRLP